MKFVRPLYRALYQSESGKELAKETFEANYDFYHPIAAKMLSVDLGVSLESEGERRDQTNKWIYAGLSISIVAGFGMILMRRRR